MHVLLTFTTFIAGFLSPLTKKLCVPALCPKRSTLFTISKYIIVMVAEPCFICCISVAIVRAPTFCLLKFFSILKSVILYYDTFWHPEWCIHLDQSMITIGCVVSDSCGIRITTRMIIYKFQLVIEYLYLLPIFISNVQFVWFFILFLQYPSLIVSVE